MNILMIILRVIHILSGVFWVGFAIFNLAFLQPTIRATGAEGQKTLQYLMRKTRLMTSVYLAATLTMFTGLIQLGIISNLQHSFINSGWGLIITLGSVSGIIAWFIAIHFIRRIFNQMGVVGAELQSSDAPPNPEKLSEMQALVERLGKVGKTALVFMIISVIGMAAARYSIF
ncbi:MAG: hypothetical protein HQ556_12855 [Candidatus Marinimicrobia bacterium]|nr:hypothetical protein [Candidatus Neomarinimicrobiota bacterium]